MATGLNIRDFQKRYREVRYESQGSFRLTNIEHNAYLNRLTVEITHYDAYRSVSYKTLPDNTHWGYLTSFKGSSVVDNLAIKFAKQRAYEKIHDGIWNYHQATENIALLGEISSLIGNQVVDKLKDEALPLPYIEFVLDLVENVEDATDSFLEWVLRAPEASDSGPIGSTSQYTAFPVASPYPDLWKFKSDVPCSFLFRLESWYLVNPIVYSVSNPTDSEDATDDEGEYPTPDPGDGSGQGAEFPPSGAPDSRSDSRDFAEDVGQPGTGVWTFVISFSDPGNNGFCNNVPPATLQLRGFPDEPPAREFTGPPTPSGGRPGRIFTSVASLAHGGDCQINGPGSLNFIPD